jgi:hypothetical protein
MPVTRSYKIMDTVPAIAGRCTLGGTMNRTVALNVDPISLDQWYEEVDRCAESGEWWTIRGEAPDALPLLHAIEGGYYEGRAKLDLSVTVEPGLPLGPSGFVALARKSRMSAWEFAHCINHATGQRVSTEALKAVDAVNCFSHEFSAWHTSRASNVPLLRLSASLVDKAEVASEDPDKCDSTLMFTRLIALPLLVFGAV